MAELRAMAGLVVVCTALVSCTGAGDGRANTAAGVEEKVRVDNTPGETVMEKWSRSCALCHVDGQGGAPGTGNAEEWASRLDQGEQVMVERVIKGYNNMPPLGYCMDCTRQDLVELTRFMASGR